MYKDIIQITLHFKLTQALKSRLVLIILSESRYTVYNYLIGAVLCVKEDFMKFVFISG